MKTIEIDDELYQFIVSNTQAIGESASSILRRLLVLPNESSVLSVQKVTINSVNQEASSEVVDESVSSDESLNLVEDVTLAIKPDRQESIFNFINKEELAMQRGAVGRFLLILAALYRANPDSFSVVTEICGRDRLYFANSEAELAASGSSIKPKQIPESPFWVMTNSNTTRKKMMLTKAATSLGYAVDEVEKIRELL
ncbi:MAG: replication initiation negative regulator SeqA [Litorilituus sp.]|jgi:negative modulator of initiation of replication|nr:replication initiation negative regulator SeqA [Litorilituus sp.]